MSIDESVSENITDTENYPSGSSSLKESKGNTFTYNKLIFEEFFSDSDNLWTSLTNYITAKDRSLSESNNIIGYNDVWEDVQIYDGRVVKIQEDTVQIECLIDTNKEKFVVKEFYKLLLENINLDLGVYVNIRILVKKGKSTIIIKDGSNLVNKALFEKIPDLGDDEIEPVKITKL